MSNPTGISWRIIFVVVSFITIIVMVVKSCSPHADGSNTFGPSEEVSRSISRSTHSRKESATNPGVNRLLELKASGQDSVRDYASYISRMNPSKRDDALSDFADHFLGEPDELIEEVEGVAKVLFESDRSLAITFLAYFHREADILNAERALLNEWLSDDPQSLFQSLTLNETNATMFGKKHFRQISSIYANEKKSSFKDWVGFVEGLDATTDKSLQREAYTSLLDFCSPDQKDALYESISANLSTGDHLDHLIGNIIKEQAKTDVPKAIARLIEINDKPVKNAALQGFISSVSETGNVHLAIEIINSESFMDDYFVPDEDIDLEETSIVQQQEDFYDEALENLLAGVTESDPDFVLIAAEEFYSPLVKKSYIMAATSQKAKIESQNTN